MELSKEQINILSIFYKQTEIAFDDFASFGLNQKSDAYIGLYKNKYLIDAKKRPLTGNAIGSYPISVKISNEGKAAYENYCSSVDSQQREIDTLEIAKEANKIAEKANDIAEKANKKATHANLISWVAIAVSVLSVIASTVVSVLIKFLII